MALNVVRSVAVQDEGCVRLCQADRPRGLGRVQEREERPRQHQHRRRRDGERATALLQQKSCSESPNELVPDVQHDGQAVGSWLIFRVCF